MIEFDEESVGRGGQIIVRWRVVRGERDTACELGHEFGALLVRKRLELLKELLRGARHRARVPRSATGVKPARIQPCGGPARGHPARSARERPVARKTSRMRLPKSSPKTVLHEAHSRRPKTILFLGSSIEPSRSGPSLDPKLGSGRSRPSGLRQCATRSGNVSSCHEL